MAQSPLTPAQKVTVLKHLINERNDEFIQAATGLTAAQVSSIKRDHGYPDVDKMKWARDILSERAGALPVAPTPAPAPARPAAPVRPAAPHRETAPPATVPVAAAASDLDLLEEAKSSTRARTRTLGVKVTDLLAQLKQALADEAEQRAAAEAQAREDAKRKARIAELEAELATLKGKHAKKKSAAPAAGDVDAKTIRAWAAQTKTPCPTHGRVPATVRQAYAAAHPEGEVA